MRRICALALALLLASAVQAAPPEKWFDAYKRGVAAVNARSYRAGAEALQKAIAEIPNEGTSVRAGKELITYVPHFWLGIAKFNLGDVEGSLREWRTSEEQGVVARTDYYARMKDWVSRAQIEKQRNAQSDASGPKKEADVEISKALAMQVDALSAGGDRSESYRAAQRKLQDALAQFHQAGTDISGYAAARQTAREASSLFSAASDEGKKLKAARQTPLPVVKPQPQPQAPKPQPVLITNIPPVVTPPAPKVETAPPPPVESESEVAARIAVQEYRRNAAVSPRDANRLRDRLEAAKSDADFNQVAREAHDLMTALAKAHRDITPPAAATVDLSAAFRAYAAGDLAGAEQLLTRMLGTQPAAQTAPGAYALRGCVRYTRAMLARDAGALLASASADFKAALQRNRALRLDRGAFSPKLVAFFENIRVQH
jgi:hypothetical protein